MNIQQRVSVDNWYKNHESGLYIQKNKIKPVQAVRNSCLVELFDATTGKKKEEMKAENVVNTNFNRQMAQAYLMYGPLTSDMGMKPIWYEDMPFGCINLTDYAGAESDVLPYFQGNIVAWSRRDTLHYGTDLRQGCINQTESYRDGDLSTTLVFDWLTSAGNGTFRSVMFTNHNRTVTAGSLYWPTGPMSFALDNSTPSAPSSGYYGPSYATAGWLYYTNAGKVYRHKRGSTASWTRDSNGTLELIADLTSIDNAMLGIQKAGDYWYTIGNQYDKIYKFDSNFNLVSSTAFTHTNYMNGYGNPWMILNDKIYTLKWTNATDYKIYRLTLSGVEEASQQLYKTNGAFYDFGYRDSNLAMNFFYDGANIVIHAEQKTGYYASGYSRVAIVLDPSDFSIVAEFPWYSYVSSIFQGACWNADLKIIEGTGGILFWAPYPMTQTLLPAAITKTSSHMMKVSYTFTIDPAGIP